jgi:hypothetical protein
MIDLEDDLDYLTCYYINIDAGAFKDAEGNEYTGIDTTTTWNFTTAQGTPDAATSGITQAQGVAGSKQVTLIVTVRNVAGSGLPGYVADDFSVSIGGGAAATFANVPFSVFAAGGDGIYTVVFTGEADATGYSFTNLTVDGVIIEAGPATVTTPAVSLPSGGIGFGGGGGGLPPVIQSASGNINGETGGIVSFGGVTVDIPADVFPGNALFTITRLSTNEANEVLPVALRLKLGSDIFEITTTGSRNFGERTITVRIPYDPAGIAQGEQPVMQYYDDLAGKWVALYTTLEKDPVTGKWYAVVKVNHLTKFAVFSKPATVINLTIGQMQSTVDGKRYTLDTQPFVDTETLRTLVPIRFVSEALGAAVEWATETRQITIKYGGRVIVLSPGSSQ